MTVADEELRYILALAGTMVSSWEPLLDNILKKTLEMVSRCSTHFLISCCLELSGSGTEVTVWERWDQQHNTPMSAL